MSLFRWMFTRKCPQCGKQLDKGVNACRHCGADNPRSWRKCLDCGVSVAADSAKCWGCKSDLLSQPRDVIFGDRWKREEGIFALRVPIETPQQRLRHGIQVDEGMRGALYRNGEFVDELRAGYHTFTSFWSRLAGSDDTGKNVEAVVVNATPVTCIVTADDTDGIYTSGPERLCFLGLSLDVQVEDIRKLATRFMPFGFHELEESALLVRVRERIVAEMRTLLLPLRVEDLVETTDLREKAEAALGRMMPRELAPLGLKFLGVPAIVIESPALTNLRTRMGERTGGRRNDRLDDEDRIFDLDRKEERRTDDAQRADRLRSADYERAGRHADEDLQFRAEEARRDKKRREVDLANIKDDLEFRRELDKAEREHQLSAMESQHIIALRQIEQKRTHDKAAVTAGGELDELKLRQQLNLDQLQQRHIREMESEEHSKDMGELADIRQHQESAVKFFSGLKNQDKDADLSRGMKWEDNVAKNEVIRAEALQKLSPQIVAGIVRPENAAMLVKVVEALRPLPTVAVMPATAMPPASTPFPAPGTPSMDVLAHRYLSNVGVVMAGMDVAGTRTVMPLGTVWVPQGLTGVATNAHVAREVAEAMRQGAGAWVLFSGPNQALAVTGAAVHPLFGSASGGEPIPAWDVALLQLGGALPGPGLPLAPKPALHALRELQTVASLGFPAEGLAGGGMNLERPRAIAKQGVLSSLQDWSMRDTSDPEERRLLVHDLGVAGGASGSPLFDRSGLVVGIVSAGNMAMVADPRTGSLRRFPSGAMLNFAQRVDVLSDAAARLTPLPLRG